MCIISAIAGTALASSLVSAGVASSTTAAAWGILGTGALIGSGVIGTVGGVVGNIYQGKSQQAMYNYQAQVDRNNAKIAQENANQERQAGLEDARLQRIKTLQNIGVQKSALAANNLDVTEGTPLDMLEDTAVMGELDALNIQHNAERRALNYEQQAYNYSNQSNLDTLAGKNANKSGMINAIGTGVKGVGETFYNAATMGLGSVGRVSPKWL